MANSCYTMLFHRVVAQCCCTVLVHTSFTSLSQSYYAVLLLQSIVAQCCCKVLLHCVAAQWENVLKSRGGIMVNGVPREVPRPKPEGPQAQRVFGCGTSRGTPFTMIPSRLFHTFSFFRNPIRLVKRDLFQPMDSLGSNMVNV